MVDHDRTPSRRAFVGALAAGVTLLAGCNDSNDANSPADGAGTQDGAGTPDGSDEPTDAGPAGTGSERGVDATDTDIDPDGPVDGPPKQVERLDRGLVATPTGDGVLVRWRLLGTDPTGIGFDVYRDGERITDDPVTASTNYLDADGDTDSEYHVRPIVDGTEGEASKTVEAWDRRYKRIPLDRPDPVTGEEGERVTYHANDASVGDLTGDGTLDVVQQWTPSNAKDNAHEGHTSPVLLDGYTMAGEKLWRITLGPNVRAGAHYTQFQVYDYDGDGRAELAVRTADGAVDGTGTVIGDPDADHANDEGYVIEGPEFLTVFDGETGEALATEDFEPARGDVCDWGDCYGNRADRFLAATAYLDGERPSIVTTRGYYEKTMLAAWDFRDGDLDLRWLFDSKDGNRAYEGKGAHSIATADVDGDGRDEIVYGACVIDHDGTGLHTTTMRNPDVLHCGDFLPDRDGLEIFVPSENPPPGEPSASMRDAETGEYLWTADGGDVGRAMVADVDPGHRGAEAWATGDVGTWTADGERIRARPIPAVNSGIWWTGDRHRELLWHDWNGTYGVGRIDEWNPDAGRLDEVTVFDGTRSNNGTKGNPCLSGDLLGDWREEVVWRAADSSHLRLYATAHETDHRMHTMLHDPQYRTGVARQNSGYNQPPWPSFFVGAGMDDPPRPNVEPVDASAADE